MIQPSGEKVPECLDEMLAEINLIRSKSYSLFLEPNHLLGLSSKSKVYRQAAVLKDNAVTRVFLRVGVVVKDFPDGSGRFNIQGFGNTAVSCYFAFRDP